MNRWFGACAQRCRDPLTRAGALLVALGVGVGGCGQPPAGGDRGAAAATAPRPDGAATASTARVAQLAPVWPGVDVALAEPEALSRRFGGKRVGLLTHSSAVTRDGRRTVDALSAAGVELVRLFTPEHGFGADREGPIENASDSASGLPLVSLYGAARVPSAADLADLDLFVVDLQDVGARFYTYAATLVLALEACAAAELAVVVLDRPNPLGGELVAGPLPDRDRVDLQGLVCWHALPVLHGMTLGELALLARAERSIAVALEVVPAAGWRRAQRFDQTGLPWMPPSPNLPTFESALAYAGPALWEFTNLSVGRGTGTPFQSIGAPWCDAAALCDALERDPPAGVVLAPTAFTPAAGPHANERCHGVRFAITDPARFDPVEFGLALAAALVRVHPDLWDRGAIDRLLANRDAAHTIAGGGDFRALLASFASDVALFEARRRPHLLYER